MRKSQNKTKISKRTASCGGNYLCAEETNKVPVFWDMRPCRLVYKGKAKGKGTP
jgi:hypothetical protein